MPGLLAVAPLVAPALGGAALISKAAGIGTALTKAALTGLTAYEGAKMIPYFTNHEDVLRDLMQKDPDKNTGNINLNWLDRLRAGGANLGGLNDDGQITNKELQEYLINKQQARDLKKHESALELATRKAELEDAEIPESKKREAAATLGVLEAQADSFTGQVKNDAARIQQEGEIAANELLLGKTKVLGEIERSLAETDLLRQQGLSENEIALARLGLEEQRGLMMQQERRQDKAADRRQAIFMALMSLMS